MSENLLVTTGDGQVRFIRSEDAAKRGKTGSARTAANDRDVVDLNAGLDKKHPDRCRR